MMMAPGGAATIALGTMTFGDTADERGATAMIDLALEHGVTVVDTANAYAGGESERIVGRVLRHRRENVTLVTKAGLPHPDAEGAAPLSAGAVRRCLEGSLRRLDTDHVDLFLLHAPDRTTTIEETLGAVAALAAEGKLRAFGVSNYAAWQIAQVREAAARVGAPVPDVAQQLYNLVARRLEDEYAEFASENGVHTMVYNPLGGGLLAGGHAFDEQVSTGRFGDSALAVMYRERYWNRAVFDAVGRLAAVADEAGLPLAELSLRWLLGESVVSSVLVGGTRPEHLRDNLRSATRGALPEAVHAACRAATEPLRGAMPAYNR